jgi:hypothetical protein
MSPDPPFASDDDFDLPSEPFDEPANDDERELDHALGRPVLNGDGDGGVTRCEQVLAGVWVCERTLVGLVNGDINGCESCDFVAPAVARECVLGLVLNANVDSGVTGRDCVPEWR